jgi:hypothetical protein
MLTPMIHLNGSNPEDLLGRIKVAYEACVETNEALAAVAPNPRDYYPISDTAFEAARVDFLAMRQKVESVTEELGALWWNLCGWEDAVVEQKTTAL